MSAFGIGRERPRAEVRGADPGAYVSRVVRWIPGEVLALFAAAVTWVGDGGGGKPSVSLLIVFMIACPILVLLGAWSRGSPMTRVDAVNAALSLPAFAIWSLSMPDSGWQRWSLVSEHNVWTAVVAALAGIAFGLFCAGVEVRLTGDEQLAAPGRSE